MTNWKIGDDILDSRDVEERIDELEALETDYLEHKEAYDEILEDRDEYELVEVERAMRHLQEASEDFPAVEREELKKLRDFRSELEGYCDWTSGEVLIEESYRQTYAEQIAEEIGAIDKDANWPLRHIDWEAATDELFRFDYTSADIEGFTYYARTC